MIALLAIAGFFFVTGLILWAFNEAVWSDREVDDKSLDPRTCTPQAESQDPPHPDELPWLDPHSLSSGLLSRVDSKN